MRTSTTESLLRVGRSGQLGTFNIAEDSAPGLVAQGANATLQLLPAMNVLRDRNAQRQAGPVSLMSWHA